MKRTGRWFLVVVVMVMLLTVPGHAAAAGLLGVIDVYVTGGASGVFPTHLRSQTPALEDSELKAAFGWYGGVGLGLPPFRLGYRMGSQTARVENITVAETTLRSSFWLVELQMDVRGLRSIVPGPFVPYLGVGLGGARYRYRQELVAPESLRQVGAGGIGTSYELPSGSHFVWSPMVGLSYRLARGPRPVDMVLGYRFVSGKIERTHAVDFGLRVSW